MRLSKSSTNPKTINKYLSTFKWLLKTVIGREQIILKVDEGWCTKCASIVRYNKDSLKKHMNSKSNYSLTSLKTQSIILDCIPYNPITQNKLVYNIPLEVYKLNISFNNIKNIYSPRILKFVNSIPKIPSPKTMMS